jgi:hypothetical protein
VGNSVKTPVNRRVARVKISHVPETGIEFSQEPSGYSSHFSNEETEVQRSSFFAQLVRSES